ncbi:MAG: hypothetical protein QOH76_723 [Thermoleophilaceae bacterium]|nr:hypothetical protein [Thermoleophilaceae bacterium]
MLIPACALFLLATTSALAASNRELGQYPDEPLPAAACPATPCEAIGHVTGFLTQVGKHKNPYLVGRNGKIVAFTIRLGKPDATQTQFFANLFGTRPSARLTILKRPKSDKRGGTQKKVLAQSEVFILTRYLGSTPTFALSKPLPISAGSTVALTVPTWAPAFAVRRPADEAWRASRPKNDCTGTSQAALQTVGKVGLFDCLYQEARPIYTATFVPDPAPTS